MTGAGEVSWLVGKPARTVVVTRMRTHEARAELARAVVAQSGAPEWQQQGYAWRAYDRAMVIVERVGADMDVLIEAFLWDGDVQQWCWAEVHERCCNEANAHGEDAWQEAVSAITSEWGPHERPVWLSQATWQRLRRKMRRATEPRRYAVIGEIENDTDLEEECHAQGLVRHQAECVRGGVGGDFHSMP